MCGNEGCRMVVNKCEKENHEKNICKFRISMCHDCKEIKASQDEMKASQDKIMVRFFYSFEKVLQPGYRKKLLKISIFTFTF